MTRRTLMILANMALIATLGACHQGQKAGHGEVSGQILPGSVSDAMLPYDAVKSKAPLAPRQSAGSNDNGPADTPADSSNTAAEADPAANLAASPAPAAPAIVN